MTFESRPLSPTIIERRLLLLAAAFMLLYSTALTLSPAARVRSWQADLRWDHWIGFAIWLAAFAFVHIQASNWLPGRDPYLLPVAALLSGWGLLTVWRLIPGFGMRQTAWLALSVATLAAGLRFPGDLGFLRRYKYVWLTGALLLTAVTLLLGVNPMGFGPRMWLGCCGVYLQPSEPLKLLLVAYLAAYMADLQPFWMLEASGSADGPQTQRSGGWIGALVRGWARLVPLLAPTLLMTGLALAILIVQRDLGAALIYFALYAAVVYLASCRRSVLAVTLAGLLGAGVLGYRLFDVVRVRVDAWVNPWLDPAGRSYQIIQSIMAVANGGVTGRGPGLGSPALAPLAHSDLIFSALAEESGLLGVIALLLLIGLLAVRGLQAAIQARSPYHRYLAGGLVTLLAGQSLLIIGGNLRLLPLTGVTLPFVSYGGSSLLTTFICLLLLLHISDRGGRAAAPLYRPAPYIELGGLLLAGLLACAMASGWWTLARNGDLLTRTDNQRRYIADRYVRRGAIVDRNNRPISASEGAPGEMVRRVMYPALSSLVGYTDPTYGQAGVEAALDPYLRGLRGNPGLDIWWEHLLYGMPPAGLDIRLSLDLDLQQAADDLLGDRRGALLALNAENGEILALASHPTFDANVLAEQYETLINDPGAPLFNRAVLGSYPLGDLAGKLFPEGMTALSVDPLPPMRLFTDAVLAAEAPGMQPEAEGYSPLQVALAAAALANGGVRPAPQFVTGIQTPQAGWLPLEPLAASQPVLSAQAVQERVGGLAVANTSSWLTTAVVPIAGAEPGAEGTWAVAGGPYVVVVFIEENNPTLAVSIALEMLGK